MAKCARTLVEQAWLRVPERFAGVELDAFIVIPDHFHGIIFLGTDPKATPPSLEPDSSSLQI